MLSVRNRKRFVAYSALPIATILGAVLLIASRPVFAQASGPLSPATPSDQPVASTPAPAPPSSNNRIGDKPNLTGTWKENQSQSDDPRQKMRAAAQQSQRNDPNATPDASQGPDGGFGGRPGYGGGPYGGPGGQNSGYPGGQGGGLGGPGGQYPQNGGPYGGANGGPNGGPYGGPNNAPGNENENVGGARGDEQLVIEQTDTSARISNGSGRLIAAYAATDQDQAAASSDSNSSDDKGEKKNRRKRNAPAVAQWDGDRLIATTQMGGGSMTRTYELSPDGRQLFVTTKIENRRFNSPVTYRLVYDAVTVSNDGKNR